VPAEYRERLEAMLGWRPTQREAVVFEMRFFDALDVATQTPGRPA